MTDKFLALSDLFYIIVVRKSNLVFETFGLVENSTSTLSLFSPLLITYQGLVDWLGLGTHDPTLLKEILKEVPHHLTSSSSLPITRTRHCKARPYHKALP